MENERPSVGVAVILMRSGNDVLLGKRKGSHGTGTWSFPGGKLEHYETSRQRALIELTEETGLTDKNVILIDKHPWKVTEDFFPEGLHYLTVYLRAKYISGNPRVMEPDKCEEWRWYSWSNLTRNNLFIPVRNLINLGYNPFK